MDGPGQIEGAIEDAVGAKAFAGQGLAGAGGGGDDEMMVREGVVELANKAAGGKDFSDGDGMKPDEWAIELAFGKTHATEAFAEAFAVLLRGGHLPEPPGGSEEQNHD
jgi:hypothetical protein